jgi:hypothetical protein
LDVWMPATETTNSIDWRAGNAVPPCSLFPNDKGCGNWDVGISKHRYHGRTLAVYIDGHASSASFTSTYGSVTDNQWDLH